MLVQYVYAPFLQMTCQYICSSGLLCDLVHIELTDHAKPHSIFFFQFNCIIQYRSKTRSLRALVASRLAIISIRVPLSWEALGILFLLPFEILFTSTIRYKSIVLSQMTNLNMIFHVVVSVYRLVKIRNSPQFPDEFRNGLLKTPTPT